MRGEYLGAKDRKAGDVELPPRARRILHQINPYTGEIGTTSACAENTIGVNLPIGSYWNYLRVRGEYAIEPTISARRMELPPRARRILGRRHPKPTEQGTTSACAENTSRSQEPLYTARNYLRVRGEYEVPGVGIHGPGELPPRARRILEEIYVLGGGFGTTSACAENTA